MFPLSSEAVAQNSTDTFSRILSRRRTCAAGRERCSPLQSEEGTTRKFVYEIAHPREEREASADQEKDADSKSPFYIHLGRAQYQLADAPALTPDVTL